MKRWWVCTLWDFSPVWVFSSTRGKARYKILLAAWDAYDRRDVSFKDIRVVADKSGLTPLRENVLYRQRHLVQ